MGTLYLTPKTLAQDSFFPIAIDCCNLLVLSQRLSFQAMEAPIQGTVTRTMWLHVAEHQPC